jgi:P-type Cu+ transporter
MTGHPDDWMTRFAGTLDRGGESAMAKDPVCGMQVDEQKAAGQSVYKGKTYYFCNLGCKAKFDKNPEQYAKT